MKLTERAEELLDVLLLMKVKLQRQKQSLALRSSCFDLDAGILDEFEHCKNELIAAYTKDSEPTDCLFPLAGGAEPRMYAVHSAVGSVYGYRHVARLLSPRLAVFGFSRVGGEMPASVGAAAEMYVKELLTHSSGAPFVLYGGSAGGLLALEMTRILEEMGRPPMLLAMVDAFDPQFTLLATEEGLTPTGWIAFVEWHCHRGWLPQLTEPFWSLTEADKLEWLASRRSEKLPASWRSIEDLASIYTHFQQFWIDVKRIRLQALKTPSLYFRATHSPAEYSKSIRDAMGDRSCDKIEIEGRHLALFQPVRAAAIARPLSRRISELMGYA